MTKETRNEWLKVTLFSLLTVLISAIPYGSATLKTPNNKVFTGDIKGHFDYNTYLTWMEQARRGHLLFRDKYTSEPNQRVLFNPLFLSLGLVSRITGLSLQTVAEVARQILGLALLMVAYLFISLFITDKGQRFLAFALLLLSSGLGFLVLMSANIARLEGAWYLLGTTEINTFQIVLAPAIFSLAALLLFLIFTLFLKALAANESRFFLLAGLLLGLLALTHPFTILIALPVLTIYILVQWLLSGRFPIKPVLVILIAAPFIGYEIWASLANPIFREHAWQEAATLSPRFLFFIGGLGFLLPLTLLGIFKVFFNIGAFDRILGQRYLFALIWLCLVPILMYLPIHFQRRAAFGVHLPLCIFSTMGVVWLIEKLKFNKKMAWALVFLLVFPSNAMLFIQEIRQLSTARKMEKGLAAYIDKGFYNGFIWLRHNTNEDHIIFCDWNIGNYIPRVSGNTVFVGHWPQTLHFHQKQALVEKFFNPATSDELRKQILALSQGDFLFYSFKERSFGAFNPDKVEYLKAVYDKDDVKIFKVIKSSLAKGSNLKKRDLL